MNMPFRILTLTIAAFAALGCPGAKTGSEPAKLKLRVGPLAVSYYCVNVMGTDISGWDDQVLTSPNGYAGVQSGVYSGTDTNEIEMDTVTAGDRIVQLISSSDNQCSFTTTSTLYEIARGSVTVIGGKSNEITLAFNDNPTATDVRAWQNSVATTPGVPTLSVISQTAITVSWSDVSDETGYRLERSIDGTTYAQVGSDLAAGTTSYADTGLTAATQYWYRLKAFNANGESSASTAATDTTLPNAPSAPSALLLSNVTSSSIDLAWTDNSSNETGFKIERSPDNSTWAEIATVSAGVVTYTNSGLSASTQYYYRVRAYNGGGNSSYTASANATTSGSSPPADPSALVGFPDPMNAPQVMLTWTDNSSDETGFEIERSTSSGAGFAQIGTAAANATSYSDTTALASTTYYYRVRAVNAGGNSGYTSEATVVNP